MAVLILGASGFVGSALLRSLRTAGVDVRAASRRADASPGWVRADAEDPGSLRAALVGVDCVYYLVHSIGADHWRETERRCAENLARAAEASRCERIVYLGGVAPHGEPSEHLASRLEVGEILRAGMVPAIELRASMIVGNGSASWRIVRDLAARLPFMVLPRWLESKTCPIALPDVVTALADARRIEADSAWFDLPGPDVLRMREMLDIVGALMGRRIPAVRVPLLTPRLSAMWLKLITSADYPLARELVAGLREDLLPADARYWTLTGHAPRWSFQHAAADALATEKQPSWSVNLIEHVVARLSPHVA